MWQPFKLGLVVALVCGFAAPIKAQQDQMQHGGMNKDTMAGGDTMGKDTMGKDAMGKDAMGKDAMGKDAMGKDGMAMEHGTMMMPHGSIAGTGGHKAGGSFSVAIDRGETVLRLGSDFWVDAGPELYIVLSGTPGLSDGALFLGKLSKFSGAQAYPVPAGTDLKALGHLVLWSKRDKAAFGVASLAAGDAMMHK